MKAAEFKKLGDYVKIKTGKLDANASSDDGEYPFFTCSIEPLKISSFSYDCECCLVAGNGDLNVKYYNGKFDAYQRTYIIESLDKEKLDVMYLYFFLCSYIEVLRNQSIGGVIKYIKLGNLTDALIPIPSLEKQKKICRNLIQAQKVLNENQALLSKYDILIKSRFIEMFGDPVKNTKGWKTKSLQQVAPAKPSKNVFNDKVWLLNLDMVESQTGKIIDYLYVNISDTGNSTYQFDEGNVLYSKLRPYLNKVVIPEQPGICTSELVPLRPTEKLNRYFLANLLRTDFFVNFINEKVAGAKMPRVSMDIFRAFDCILPPIELQNNFASFIQQIDKSKFENESEEIAA